MTPDQQQRDAAARILAQLAPLEPAKRPAVIGLVVQALARCTAAAPEITPQESGR
jgi:hypothetical protein